MRRFARDKPYPRQRVRPQFNTTLNTLQPGGSPQPAPRFTTMRVVNLKPWLWHKRMVKPPTGIILHATAGHAASTSISTLRAKKLGYHAIIDRDGSILKCIPSGPPATRTSHAGMSRGWAGMFCNSYTVGIAFANLNNGEKVTPEQEASAEAYIRQLMAAYPTIKYISTHRLISWGRKSDPWKFNFLPMAERLGLKPWRKTEGHSWF